MASCAEGVSALTGNDNGDGDGVEVEWGVGFAGVECCARGGLVDNARRNRRVEGSLECRSSGANDIMVYGEELES